MQSNKSNILPPIIISLANGTLDTRRQSNKRNISLNSPSLNLPLALKFTQTHPLWRQWSSPVGFLLLDAKHSERVGEVGRGAAQLAHQRPFCLFAIPAQEDADAERSSSQFGFDKNIFSKWALYVYVYVEVWWPTPPSIWQASVLDVVWASDTWLHLTQMLTHQK